MAEQKRNFLGGKINIDVDDRILQPGEYRVARNVSITRSENADVGALENILGNKDISPELKKDANYDVIGSVTDPLNDRIYWFFVGPQTEGIYELDISPNFDVPQEVIEGETYIPNPAYGAPKDVASRILEFDVKRRIFNFSTNHLITGANVQGNLLYWTDNLNPPRKINVDRFRGAGNYYAPNSDNRYNLQYVTENGVIVEEVSETVDADFPNARFFEDKNPRYDRNGEEFLSLSTDLFDSTPEPSITGDLIGVAKRPPLYPPTWIKPMDARPPSDGDYISERFLYFATRFKYRDGEVSSLSPFSSPIFYPKRLDLNTGLQRDPVSLSSMVNENSEVDICYDAGNSEVVEVELVLTEGLGRPLYSVSIINKEEEEIPSSTPYQTSIQKFRYDNNKTYILIPEDQILRVDDVPLRAQSQEIIGNRLVYGNYTRNYPLTTVGPDGNRIIPNLSVGYTSTTRNPDNNRAACTVKTDRDYEFGIVYLDIEGRQSPVLTSRDASIHIPFNDSTDGGIATHTNRNQFEVTIDHPAPYWATHYRFFIKQNTAEYYNVFPKNVIKDNKLSSTRVYLQIDSSDVNKIQADTRFVLKGINDSVQSERREFRVAIYGGEDRGFVTDTNITNFSVPFEFAQRETNNGFAEEELVEKMESILPLEENSRVYQLSQLPQDEDDFSRPNVISVRVAGVNVPQNGSATIDLDGTVGSDPAVEVNWEYNTDQPDRIFFNRNLGDNTVEIDYEYYSVPSDADARSDFYVAVVPYDQDDIAVFKNYVGTVSTSDETSIWETLPTADLALDDQLFYSWGQTFRCLNGSHTTVENEIFLPTDLIQEIYVDGDTIPEGKNIGDNKNAVAIRSSFFNCFSYTVGIEETHVRGEFNRARIFPGIKASTINEEYREREQIAGLIHSGLFSDEFNLNGFNEFNRANPIERLLFTPYGSIQKLYAWGDYLFSYQEDRICRIPINENIIQTTDGQELGTTDSNFFGNEKYYADEYGISLNPESHMAYGGRQYFADKNNGSLLRLSQDGITELSRNGIETFVRSQIREADLIVGTHDDYNEQPNFTLRARPPQPRQGQNTGIHTFSTYSCPDPRGTCNLVDNPTVADGRQADNIATQPVYSILRIPEAGILRGDTLFSDPNRECLLVGGNRWFLEIHDPVGTLGEEGYVPRNNRSYQVNDYGLVVDVKSDCLTGCPPDTPRELFAISTETFSTAEDACANGVVDGYAFHDGAPNSEPDTGGRIYSTRQDIVPVSVLGYKIITQGAEKFILEIDNGLITDKFDCDVISRNRNPVLASHPIFIPFGTDNASRNITLCEAPFGEEVYWFDAETELPEIGDEIYENDHNDDLVLGPWDVNRSYITLAAGGQYVSHNSSTWGAVNESNGSEPWYVSTNIVGGTDVTSVTLTENITGSFSSTPAMVGDLVSFEDSGLNSFTGTISAIDGSSITVTIPEDTVASGMSHIQNGNWERVYGHVYLTFSNGYFAAFGLDGRVITYGVCSEVRCFSNPEDVLTQLSTSSYDFRFDGIGAEYSLSTSGTDTTILDTLNGVRNAEINYVVIGGSVRYPSNGSLSVNAMMDDGTLYYSEFLDVANISDIITAQEALTDNNVSNAISDQQIGYINLEPGSFVSLPEPDSTMFPEYVNEDETNLNVLLTSLCYRGLTDNTFGDPLNLLPQAPTLSLEVSHTGNIEVGTVVTITPTAADADGTIESFVWELADGLSFASGENNMTPGAITVNSDTGLPLDVTLTVTDSNLISVSRTVRLNYYVPTANVIPVASITPVNPTDAEALVGNNIELSGSGTDSDGTIARWIWRLPETNLVDLVSGNLTGTGSTPGNITVTSDVVGDHQITLTVIDNVGGAGTTNQEINFTAPGNPTLSISIDPLVRSQIAGGLFSLTSDAVASSPAFIAEYEWTVPDGIEFIIGNESSPNITITSDVEGSFDLSLTATDSYNRSVTEDVRLTFYGAPDNVPPIANINLPGADNGTVSSFIQLDGMGEDPDGRIASWEWTIPADTEIITGNLSGNGSVVGSIGVRSFTTGSYTIELEVTDEDGGTDSDAEIITFNALGDPIRPSVSIQINPIVRSQVIGNSFSLDSTASGAGDLTISSYSWAVTTTGNASDLDFIVGTTSSEDITVSSDVAGTYDLTLTVTDSAGTTNSEIARLTFTDYDGNIPPTANINLVTTNTAVIDSDIALTGSGQDLDGTITNWEWTLPDGVTLSAGNLTGTGATVGGISVSSSTVGEYEVTLTVTDDSGETGTEPERLVFVDPDPIRPTIDSIVTSPADATALINGTITADVTVTDPDGVISTYEWNVVDDFGAPLEGDGIPVITETNSQGDISITSAAKGAFNLRFVATDDQGLSAEQTIVVNFYQPDANIPPVINNITGNPTETNINEPISLSATATDSDGTIASWRWELPQDMYIVSGSLSGTGANIGDLVVSSNVERSINRVTLRVFDDVGDFAEGFIDLSFEADPFPDDSDPLDSSMGFVSATPISDDDIPFVCGGATSSTTITDAVYYNPTSVPRQYFETPNLLTSWDKGPGNFGFTTVDPQESEGGSVFQTIQTINSLGVVTGDVAFNCSYPWAYNLGFTTGNSSAARTLACQNPLSTSIFADQPRENFSHNPTNPNPNAREMNPVTRLYRRNGSGNIVPALPGLYTDGTVVRRWTGSTLSSNIENGCVVNGVATLNTTNSVVNGGVNIFTVPSRGMQVGSFGDPIDITAFIELLPGNDWAVGGEPSYRVTDSGGNQGSIVSGSSYPYDNGDGIFVAGSTLTETVEFFGTTIPAITTYNATFIPELFIVDGNGNSLSPGQGYSVSISNVHPDNPNAGLLTGLSAGDTYSITYTLTADADKSFTNRTVNPIDDQTPNVRRQIRVVMDQVTNPITTTNERSTPRISATLEDQDPDRTATLTVTNMVDNASLDSNGANFSVLTFTGKDGDRYNLSETLNPDDGFQLVIGQDNPATLTGTFSGEDVDKDVTFTGTACHYPIEVFFHGDEDVVCTDQANHGTLYFDHPEFSQATKYYGGDKTAASVDTETEVYLRKGSTTLRVWDGSTLTNQTCPPSAVFVEHDGIMYHATDPDVACGIGSSSELGIDYKVTGEWYRLERATLSSRSDEENFHQSENYAIDEGRSGALQSSFNDTTGYFSPPVSGYYDISATATWNMAESVKQLRNNRGNNHFDIAIGFARNDAGSLGNPRPAVGFSEHFWSFELRVDQTTNMRNVLSNLRNRTQPTSRSIYMAAGQTWRPRMHLTSYNVANNSIDADEIHLEFDVDFDFNFTSTPVVAQSGFEIANDLFADSATFRNITTLVDTAFEETASPVRDGFYSNGSYVLDVVGGSVRNRKSGVCNTNSVTSVNTSNPVQALNANGTCWLVDVFSGTTEFTYILPSFRSFPLGLSVSAGSPESVCSVGEPVYKSGSTSYSATSSGSECTSALSCIVEAATGFPEAVSTDTETPDTTTTTIGSGGAAVMMERGATHNAPSATEVESVAVIPVSTAQPTSTMVDSGVIVVPEDGATVSSGTSIVTTDVGAVSNLEEIRMLLGNSETMLQTTTTISSVEDNDIRIPVGTIESSTTIAPTTTPDSSFGQPENENVSNNTGFDGGYYTGQGGSNGYGSLSPGTYVYETRVDTIPQDPVPMAEEEIVEVPVSSTTRTGGTTPDPLERFPLGGREEPTDDEILDRRQTPDGLKPTPN